MSSIRMAGDRTNLGMMTTRKSLQMVSPLKSKNDSTHTQRQYPNAPPQNPSFRYLCESHTLLLPQPNSIMAVKGFNQRVKIHHPIAPPSPPPSLHRLSTSFPALKFHHNGVISHAGDIHNGIDPPWGGTNLVTIQPFFNFDPSQQSLRGSNWHHKSC